MSKHDLTVQSIDEALKRLVKWKRFAHNLPGIDETTLSIIEENRPLNIVDQKFDLYKEWLRVCPSASWEHIIEALKKADENRIASELEMKLLPVESQVMNGKAGEAVTVEIKESKEVVDELTKLNLSFIRLAVDIKRTVETRVKNGELCLDYLVRCSAEDVINIPQLDSVKTISEYLKVIEPHYNFLNCYLMVPFLVYLLFPSSVDQRAAEYRTELGKFMRSTKIAQLQNILHRYTPTRSSETHLKVSIRLENAWERHTLKLVEVLINTVVPPYQFQWFRVLSGSLLVNILLSKHMMMLAIVNSVKKLQFMRLVGVIGLQVGSIVVLQEKETGSFTFNECLIEAAVEDNTEVVEFVLQHISDIDVNIQSTRTFAKLATSIVSEQSELTVAQTILEVFGSFIQLVNEIEFELWSAVNYRRVSTKQLLVAYVRSQSVRTIEDFFEVLGCNSTFLNNQIIVRLAHLLSNFLRERILKYNARVGLIKYTTKLIYLSELFKFNPLSEMDNTVKLFIKFEKAWCECNMWCVELLLRYIFPNTFPEMFQWSKVTPTPLTITFTIPEDEMMGLVSQSAKKLQFMEIVGVTSMQIGLLLVLKRKENICYNFKLAELYAKLLRNGEAEQFLQQIEQQQLKNCITDSNQNYHVFPDRGSTPLMIACCHDNMQMVQLLLEHGADPNIQNNRKHTALMYACRNTEMLRALMSYNADSNIQDLCHQTAVFWTCMVGNVQGLELFIGENNSYYTTNQESVQATVGKHLVNLNCRNIYGATFLHVACHEGHLHVIERLLKAKADSNVHDILGLTPLLQASASGHFQMVKLFLNIAVRDKKSEAQALLAACRHGHVRVVKQLLEAQIDPNIQDSKGTTPLMIASTNGHLDVVEQLLDAQADPSIQTHMGETALANASFCGHFHVVKKLLETCADQSTKALVLPLFVACIKGHVEVVRLLLEAHADPNIQLNVFHGSSPLHPATHHGHVEIVKLFLKAQAEVNIQNDSGRTPLFNAIKSGHLTIAELLLDAKADPNIQDNTLSTPLHIACCNGYLQIVKMLLHAQVHLNVQITDGRTPLHIASSHGHSQIVDQLLEAKADPNILDGTLSTSLHMACRNGHLQIVKMLLHAHVHLNVQNTDGRTPLHIASWYGHSQIVDQLLEAKADPNILNGTLSTPLHIACRNGHLQIVKMLLHAHVHLNVQNTDGRTPLHIASWYGHSQIVDQLLEAKADPNILNGTLSAPLHMACRNGHLQIVKMLLYAQAHLNVQNTNGRTPLHIASWYGHSQIVDQLLEAKADPNILNGTLSTPLHKACRNGHLQIVKMLLHAQAHLNVQNTNGRTPLHIASWYGHSQIVDQLLEAKANPNAQDMYGTTPLYIASCHGFTQIVENLLDKKADPNIRAKNRTTPLHMASLSVFFGSNIDKVPREVSFHPNIDLHVSVQNSKSHLQIVKKLLEAQANPNVQDNYGATPLLIACEKGLLCVVELLLEAHADLNIKDNNGATPLFVAMINGHHLIVQRLLEAHANLTI